MCFFISCNKKPTQEKPIGKNQDEILNTYLKNGAWKHHYTTKEWDEWINKGLKQDSTIAYLWQQRAMPLWKQKKYQLAISYFDKAVALDRKKWLSRLGFLKCIFAKDYNAALKDLTTYKQEFGSTYEQDHSLEFYIGLCYLQLNHYDKALVNLQESVNYEIDQHGENWVHYLDRFYLAIAFYELGEYKKAILEFDKVLKEYPNFSDAKYYKSISLNYLNKKEEAKLLMAEGKLNFKNGNTFNEDSSLYEDYPYQLTWQWEATDYILK